MDVSSLALWSGLVLGLIPLLAQAIWYWNDILFSAIHLWRGTKLPPGYMGLPFFGETLTFLLYFKILCHPDDFINSKKRRYGDGVGMFRSHLFGSPTIITCAPGSNKFILQNCKDFHIRWPVPELIGFKSIVNVEGKQHERLRSFIINAVNQPNSLQKIAAAVQPPIVAALHSWAEKGIINAFQETKKVTFENICKMFVSMDPQPLTESIDKYFQDVVSGLRAFPIDIPGSAVHKALKSRRKLTKIFKEELEKRKLIHKKNEISSDESYDLMDGLMRLKDEEGKQLRDEEVVDNIVSVVLGGYESTSLAIMWALYFISESPHVFQKLKEENIETKKNMKGDYITMEEISKMKYTANVVEETIRMANVAPMIPRVAAKDIYYKGFLIPKGWSVLVWLRSLHTDENNFNDPLKFNPERWNNPAKPGAFQGFGGGPRICAGNMLARIQLSVMLHHLSLNYKWKLVNPEAKIMYLPHPKPIDGALMTFQYV